jgi:diguanylate cyclase (GGDEF)-like protein/PAS domain S-box-containing protein
MDVSALRMREATITAGLWLTLGVGALGSTYVAFTWERPHRLELAVLFALATVTGILIAVLPRERIVRSRWREPFFLSWTMSDFVLLVVATMADGGTSSPLVLVFFIPVVFSSMSYPLASVVTTGVVSVLSYLLVALAVGGSSATFEGAFAIALACTAAMSAWQAQNHNRQHRALAAVSRTDPLTGCLNRRGFEERALAELSAMSRSGASGAIVVLDINHFKLVNDMFGHATGDDLLCWVSSTLERAVRSADAVGRLGGDEFAVLLPEIDARLARAGAKRIGDALRERAPASLGLAVFPDEEADLEGLLRRADARLYESRQGRLGPAHALSAEQAMPAVERPVAAAPVSPGQGVEPIDLWKAALDAMPDLAGNGRRRLDPTDLRAALLDQLDASVVVTDMTGQVISWNSGAELLYGWTSEEAVGRSAKDLVVPDDAQAAERLVLELRREGRWDGEIAVRHKDGSAFTAYVRNRLILDENGSPSAIVGVAVDISARVAAETELLQSRNYVQAVTECIGDGLFTLDVDGRLTYANRSAEAMLGWPDGELLGQAIGDAIYALRPDGSARPFAHSQIAPALSQETTVRVEDDVFRTRNGRQLPVAYTAAPFHTEDGLQGCVVIFQDITERKLREEEQRRDAATLACINRVEAALAEDRFVLHAQPIVDLRSGLTVQHELLLRMRERDGTIIPPGDFLPAAEHYALIGELDWWVIRQATRLAGAGSPVELNLSARSVVDIDVVEHIERCMEQCEVPPGRLVFEITETAIVEDPRAARVFAERMHALGCKVALDDFGTGYGTLTYLKQIPVDYLKLDIEFVRDLLGNSASRHVVQAVVALARDFHIHTVAEGVEDADTLDLLSQLGVDFVQGYHLARPEPFAERPGDQSAPVKTSPRSVRHSEPRRSFPRRPAARSRLRS